MTDRIFTHTDPDKSITVDFGHGEDISNEISYHFENGDLLTSEEIKKQYWRETDIIWSVEDVKKGVKRHVDMQCLDRERSI